MRKYSEALIAAGYAAVVAVIGFLSDGFTTTEKVMVGVAAVGAVATWLASNVDVPYFDQTKAIVFGLNGALIALVAVIEGGVTGAEWVQIAGAALAAAGIWQVPSFVSARPALDPESDPFPPTRG